MEKRCYGCMNIKVGGPFCEHCGFDERIQNAAHQLPMGTLLKDQYIVGKALGQGGFGITYMGYDRYLNTPVAIKEYYPSGFVTRDAAHSTFVTSCTGSNTEVVETNRKRFLREAQSLAKLSGIPEVVRVQNFFPENGTAYIVMEFVQGRTLKDYVNQYGALSAEWLLNLLRPLMNALHKVHETGIVHRDLSPDNIMVMPDGRVKLLDFGAVRDYGLSVTHNTQAILKPGFAPPEQYQTNGNIGPWTDVYAFCATLYYCMTGRMVPEAPKRMMENVHPDWSQIPGLLPHQIFALERGVALRYNERTQTMGDLVTQVFLPTIPHPPIDLSQRQSHVQEQSQQQSRVQQSRQSQVQQSQSSQNQVSEEALERAREWKRQQAQQKEQARLEQERAQRLADERAQREALLRAHQAQSNAERPPVWKKLIPIIGVALAVVIGLALLVPTDEEQLPREEEPAVVNTQTSPAAEEKPASVYSQAQIDEVLNALEPHRIDDDTYENFNCEAEYTSDGMELLAPGLHLVINNRDVTIDIGGLNIQDSYVIDYDDALEYYAEASWTVTMVGDNEEVRISTDIVSTEPGNEKHVTMEDMDHGVSVEVEEGRNEAVTTIDVFEYDKNHIHWELDIPAKSEYDYNKDLEIPFDFSQFHTIYVSATDRYHDVYVTRVYNLK